MKHTLYIIILFTFCFGYSQTQETSDEVRRITNIQNQLEMLAVSTPGLTENVKTEVSVNNITLANFLLAVSNLHKVNINVAPELSQTSIANNLPRKNRLPQRKNHERLLYCRTYAKEVDTSAEKQ